MLPIRCRIAGIFIGEQLHLKSPALCDEIRAIELYGHDSTGVFPVFYISITCKCIDQQIPFVSQVICMFLTAYFDLCDFFVQFIDSFSYIINIFYCIKNLRIEVVLILDKGFIDRCGIFQKAC